MTFVGRQADDVLTRILFRLQCHRLNPRLEMEYFPDFVEHLLEAGNGSHLDKGLRFDRIEVICALQHVAHPIQDAIGKLLALLDLATNVCWQIMQVDALFTGKSERLKQL